MKRAVLLTLVSILVPLSLAAQPTLVVVDGKIFTGDPAKPYVQALAVRGTTILAAGTNEEIAAIPGDGRTRRIRLNGRVVIPGINDAHTHPGGEPIGADIGTTPNSTLANVIAQLGFFTKEFPPDIWLLATVGGPVILDPNANRAALDQAAPGRKVMLRSFTGHGMIVSSAGLAELGVPDSAPDPGGGRFERGADGKINGRVFEYAEYPLARKLVEITTALEPGVRIDRLTVFTDEAVHFGITSIQAMPIQEPKQFLSDWDATNSPIRLRLIAFPVVVPGLIPKPVLEFRGLNGLKWILDGTPIEKGAAVRTPYPTGGQGHENFTSITRLIELGLDANQQVLLHVAGDQTTETVIKTLGGISGVDFPSKRVRIEHGDGLLADLDQKAKQLGLIVVLNPTHFFAENLYPQGQFMRAKSLLKNGIRIAIGSDGPLNPYLNIMLACDAATRGNEALTREEAVIAYTAGAAFAEFQDNKGTLAPGKLADFAVLSQDIFTVPLQQLPDTRSLMTVINGKIVFREPF